MCLKPMKLSAIPQNSPPFREGPVSPLKILRKGSARMNSASKTAEAWNKSAKAYQRHIKGSAPLELVYRHFASDVAAHLRKTPGRPYRVLDVASATGEPAFSLIEILQQVEVTVTDIAEVRCHRLQVS